MPKNLTQAQVRRLIDSAIRPIGKLVVKKMAGSSIPLSAPVLLEMHKKLSAAKQRTFKKWPLKYIMSNSPHGLTIQEPLSNSQLEYLWHTLQLKKLG